MSTQDIPNTKTNAEPKREYPLYRAVRMRKVNVKKIKARATKYGQTFDEIITEMLTELGQKESKK
jgi:hypothetical protein